MSGFVNSSFMLGVGVTSLSVGGKQSHCLLLNHHFSQTLSESPMENKPILAFGSISEDSSMGFDGSKEFEKNILGATSSSV